VVAVGGDGTLNEVVNGYLDRDGRPVNPEARLGILSAGTGSDFRRSLYPMPGLRGSADARNSSEISYCGNDDHYQNEKVPPEQGVAGMPRRPFRPGSTKGYVVPDEIERAILAITGRESRLVDAGLMDCSNRRGAPVSRFFINVVSFGLGGDVSRLVNSWRRWLPAWIGGQARFAAAAVGALARYKNRAVLVRADQSEVRVESNLVVIANGRFAGGGMMLAPHARLDDGLFEVVITDRASRLDVIKELPRIRRGGYLENPKVSVLRASEVGLMTDEPIPLDIDGESGEYAPARFKVLPSAIRFAGKPEGQV
jgi:diacylglycerol kinase family enzyme